MNNAKQDRAFKRLIEGGNSGSHTLWRGIKTQIRDTYIPYGNVMGMNTLYNNIFGTFVSVFV